MRTILTGALLATLGAPPARGQSTAVTWGALPIPLSANALRTKPLPVYADVPPLLRGFFPLAIDYQPISSFEAWKAEGINTVIRVPEGVSIDAFSNAAGAVGLKMIRDARPDPDADDAELSLLAWIINDEPEEHFLLEHMRQRYRELRSYNARPIFFNFAGLTVWRTRHDRCNGPGDGSDEACYPGFLAHTDWVSNDLYPINSLGSGDSIPHVGATLDKLHRWSNAKLQVAYIETARQFPRVPTNRGPTAAELRGQVWSAIIHGARGIFYFPHGDCSTGVCGESNATPPSVQAEMRAQNAKITSLAGVLQGPINPPPMGVVVPAPLEATWRASGSERYVFVLNLSAAPVTRTVELRGVVPAEGIAVMGEHRSAGRSGRQTFSDRFGPYEVHIYRFRSTVKGETSDDSSQRSEADC